MRFVPLPVCDQATPRGFISLPTGGGVYFLGFYSIKQTNKHKQTNAPGGTSGTIGEAADEWGSSDHTWRTSRDFIVPKGKLIVEV